jgi:hypothetical protein
MPGYTYKNETISCKKHPNQTRTSNRQVARYIFLTSFGLPDPPKNPKYAKFSDEAKILTPYFPGHMT